MTGDLLWLLFLNGLFLAAGLGISGFAGWWGGAGELRRSLGVAYLVGVAVFGVVAQCLYVLGASLAREQVVLVCLIPATGIAWGLRRRSEANAAPEMHRLVVTLIVAMIGLLAVDLWFQPLWAFDSWTFWTPKAHALWALNGLDASWFTAADLISKDYPILLPSVEAAGFRFSGYETSLLDVQSLIFFAAFLRVVYEVSGRRAARPLVLSAVLLMFVAAPSVADQLAAAEADIPVAVLVASAGLLALLWLLERTKGALVLSILLAAGASATKVEGLEFAVVLYVVLALVIWRSDRRSAVLGASAGAGAVLLGVLPWRLWLHNHGIPNQGSTSRLSDPGFLIHHVGRIPIALGYMVVKMLDPRAWLFLIPLSVVIAVRRWRVDPRPVVFVAGVGSGALLGLVVAYWTTKLGFHYQLATSARRVVTGVVFLVAGATPVLAGSGLPPNGAFTSPRYAPQS